MDKVKQDKDFDPSERAEQAELNQEGCVEVPEDSFFSDTGDVADMLTEMNAGELVLQGLMFEHYKHTLRAKLYIRHAEIADQMALIIRRHQEGSLSVEEFGEKAHSLECESYALEKLLLAISNLTLGDI